MSVYVCVGESLSEPEEKTTEPSFAVSSTESLDWIFVQRLVCSFSEIMLRFKHPFDCRPTRRRERARAWVELSGADFLRTSPAKKGCWADFNKLFHCPKQWYEFVPHLRRIYFTAAKVVSEFVANEHNAN